MSEDIGPIIDRYREAVQQLEAAEVLHEVARNELHDHLQDLGRLYAETGERQIDVRTAQKIYWELPRIHTAPLGLALGTYASRVHEVINSQPYVVTCRDCGVEVERRPKSRTSDSGTSICDGCQERRTLRIREGIRRAEAAEQELEQQRITLLRTGDYWIDSEGEVVARGFPHWCRGCGGQTTPHGETWSVGSVVTYVCHECRADGKPWAADVQRKLVAYVPMQSGSARDRP